MTWGYRFALVLALAAGCDDASSEGAPMDPPTPNAAPGQGTEATGSGASDPEASDPEVSNSETSDSETQRAAADEITPSFDEATAESAVRTLEGGDCRASEPVAIGTSAARRPSIVLTETPGGYAVAWASDEQTVQLARLNAEGSLDGTAHGIPVAGAMDMRELLRLGSGFVLVGQTFCPDARHASFKCLVLTPLDENLRARAEPFVHETIEWSEILIDAIDERTFVVLRGHTYLPPVLERYRVDADGGITREQLGDLSHGVRRGEAEPPSVEGLAVRQAGEQTTIAALLRLNDDSDGHALFLHVPGQEAVRVQNRRLPEGVKDMRFASADALQMVVGESPRVVVIGLDGSIRRAPSPIGDSGRFWGWRGSSLIEGHRGGHAWPGERC